MLIDDDLPRSWRVVPDRSPIPERESVALETALGITKKKGERDLISWDEIEHVETGVRVRLRLVPTFADERRTPDNVIGATIAAMLAVPKVGEVELKGAAVRVPTNEIQTNVGLRKGEINGAWATLLGSDNPTDAQHARIAAMWLDFKSKGAVNPTHSIMEAEGVSLATAKRMVAAAREAGQLPPNARSRAGRPPRSPRSPSAAEA